MPVPKASVHEEDRPVLRQHKIRLSGDTLGVQTVAKALRMQGSAEGKLRLRILSPDPGHHARAGLTVDYVGHFTPGLGYRLGIEPLI